VVGSRCLGVGTGGRSQAVEANAAEARREAQKRVLMEGIVDVELRRMRGGEGAEGD
jgi:hypothetical protein